MTSPHARAGTPSTAASAPPARRSRSVPTNQSADVWLTERDGWILEALVKMVFATTTQIARLFFAGSRWSANKRLRQLLDGGYVRVWVRSLSLDNVYSLTRRGLLALEANPEEAIRPRVPRVLDGTLDHVLAIGDVRISLAVTLPEIGGRLAWWRSELELRAPSRSRLVPDGLFLIGWDDGSESAFALEVDRRRRSTREFAGKLIRYRAAVSGPGLFGLRTFRVLVVGCEASLLERYRQVADKFGCGELAWFATLGEVSRVGAGGAIWRSARSSDLHSLRTIATLPCRKERVLGETHAHSRTCGATAQSSFPLPENQ